jgi:hypothetical protein
MAYQRFLLWMALTLVFGCAIAAGTVLLVDPYGLYGLVLKDGVNAVKPMTTRYRYEIKLANVQRMEASTLLLGNSRVEVGFDPLNPALGGQAFNLGLAGTGTDTSVGQLQALAASGKKPQRIIAGLEFMDAMTAPGGAQAAAPVKRPSQWAGMWRFDTLFSLSSLKDSVLTLMIQRDPEAESQTLRGFTPLRQYERFVRVDGYYKIFQQRANENVRGALRKAGGHLDAATVHQEVAALLDTAARANPSVDVHLMIYPYHAQMMAIIEQSGLWDRFETWKGVLVEEVAAARARHPQARITLHDFSGYGEFNCEAIPGAGSTQHTRWYWEAGHFKATLGEVLVRRMLDSSPQDFGMELTSATFERNRARIADERAACAGRQPALFTDVDRMVREARGVSMTAASGLAPAALTAGQ